MMIAVKELLPQGFFYNFSKMAFYWMNIKSHSGLYPPTSYLYHTSTKKHGKCCDSVSDNVSIQKTRMCNVLFKDDRY